MASTLTFKAIFLLQFIPIFEATRISYGTVPHSVFVGYEKIDPCGGVFNNLTSDSLEQVHERCESARRIYNQLSDKEKVGCPAPQSAECVPKYMGIAYTCRFDCQNSNDQPVPDTLRASPQNSRSGSQSGGLWRSFNVQSKSAPVLGASDSSLTSKSISKVAKFVRNSKNQSMHSNLQNQRSVENSLKQSEYDEEARIRRRRMQLGMK